MDLGEAHWFHATVVVAILVVAVAAGIQTNANGCSESADEDEGAVHVLGGMLHVCLGVFTFEVGREIWHDVA